MPHIQKIVFSCCLGSDETNGNRARSEAIIDHSTLGFPGILNNRHSVADANCVESPLSQEPASRQSDLSIAWWNFGTSPPLLECHVFRVSILTSHAYGVSPERQIREGSQQPGIHGCVETHAARLKTRAGHFKGV